MPRTGSRWSWRTRCGPAGTCTRRARGSSAPRCAVSLRPSLTVSGWALYAQELMAEEGYFTSLETRLLHLVGMLQHAVQVDLDIGLHTRGMTPQEAIDELVKRIPIERRQAEVEVRRVLRGPGPGALPRRGAPRTARVARGGGGPAGARIHDARRSTTRCCRTAACRCPSSAGEWASTDSMTTPSSTRARQARRHSPRRRRPLVRFPVE